VQIEADDRRRCVNLYVELVGLHGEHGEEVTVRMVARGRARATIAGSAEIGARLQRARRQLAARAARAFGKFVHIGRDIHH